MPMFNLLPIDGPDCNCCSDPLLLRWHGLARKMDAHPTLEVMRDDGIKGEDGEDNFLDDELSIAAALAAAWATAVSKVKPMFMKVFDRSFSTGNMQAALDAAAPIMNNLYDDAAPEVAKAVRHTLELGAGQLGAASVSAEIPLLTTPSARSFEEAIIKATRYSTNRFFNTQIVPGILSAVDNAFHAPGTLDLASLQADIARHFRTVPYWRLIANLAASRGYHYGYLRVMQQRGIIAYQFVAVIDERTSAICRAMNGKQFLVADAVNLMDGLANDPDPMAGKTRTPWVQPVAIEGKTNTELAAMGVMVPPLHPLCRSTIQPLYR